MPNILWTGRTFGVEMEMLKQRLLQGSTRRVELSGPEINRALSAVCQMPVYGDGTYYSSRTDGRAWEVKYDMSAGFEVTSPALMMDEDGHNEELRNACGALLGLRPVIDRSCGLHVHVDVSDFDWRDLQHLLALWSRYEPFFFELCPPSRRANSYCYPLRASTWADVIGGNTHANWRTVDAGLSARSEAAFTRALRGSSSTHGLSKYVSLNLNHWWLNGRVEFRLHSGTISYRKIRAWVVILLSMVSRIKAERAPRMTTRITTPRTPFSVNYILQQIGLAPSSWNGEHPIHAEIAQWVEERRVRFGARPSRRRAPRAAQRSPEPSPAPAGDDAPAPDPVPVTRERIDAHTRRPMTYAEMREIADRIMRRTADDPVQQAMDALYRRTV